MLGLVKRLFGGMELDSGLTGELSQAVSEGGLDVEAALMAHSNWKLRLEAYLDGKSSEDLRPEVICFDDRCDLGRWIHGPGAQRLGRYRGFTALRENHRMFHYAASNVVSLNQSGRKAEARRMLDGVYAGFSTKVIDDLTGLRDLAQRRKG